MRALASLKERISSSLFGVTPALASLLLSRSPLQVCSGTSPLSTSACPGRSPPGRQEVQMPWLSSRELASHIWCNGDATASCSLDERSVIAFGLVRVQLGERGDGTIEHVAFAQVGADLGG